MTYEFVNEVPERQFPFKLSERTKQYIDFLNRLSPGHIVRFSPEEGSTPEERELYLRKVRDRLRTAIKKADGDYEYVRRDNSYYVERLRGKDEVRSLGRTTFR